MKDIVAVYGSPRRDGNSSTLLRAAVRGAREAGARVEELVLRDLTMSPCLEIYGCRDSGRCVIDDDFQQVYDSLVHCSAMMLASPIFFYSVSAHTKIMMDRFQSLWVKKYLIENARYGERPAFRKGLFISVGATRGKRLFDGTLLTVKYFMDTLDMELWRSLLYRGIDGQDEILNHPEHCDEAYRCGRELVEAAAGQERQTPT